MDHKLNCVDIKGYKSIRECSIDLRDINILIGPNGSGKSNFISSLQLLQNIVKKNLQSTVARSGINSMMYKGLKNTVEIEMEFHFDNNSYGFVLEAGEDGRLSFKDEYFGWNWGVRSDVKALPNHYESEFDKGTGNRIEDYVTPVLSAERWKVYHFHDTSWNSGMKQDHSISDSDRLQSDASNIAPFLRMLKMAYRSSYDDIMRAIKMVAPYIGGLVLDPSSANGGLIRLRWVQDGCEEVFGPNQLSDGTLRFICLAALLLQPPDLQPSVIILDEPELGLHPAAISLLAELIHLASRNKQIIISTQSPDLLDAFDADDVIVTEMTPDGSAFRRLSSEELEGWLEDCSLSTVWKKNLFGGQP